MRSIPKKRPIDPSDFIPTPTRVLAIIQLCLAFTLVCWTVLQPFMSEYYTKQQLKGLYKTLLGDQGLLIKADPEIAAEQAALLERNAKRFTQLPLNTQQELITGLQELEKASARSWGEIVSTSLHLLAFELNPFALAWLVFSITLALMLLLRIEGAQAASWLLPLLVLLYGGDKLIHGTATPPTADSALYPSEELIFSRYLQEEPASSILAQREQLLKGWRIYLIEEWTGEKPATNPQKQQQQLEAGEFAFNQARLQRLRNSPTPPITRQLHAKEPLLLILLYLIWNFGYAWGVNRKTAMTPIANSYQS